LGLLEAIALAIGLGMDAMSVSIAIGVRWHGPRQTFRLSWSMGMFQFLMPLIGWLVGAQLAGVLASIGTYVAAALVFGIGAKMLYEAVRFRHIAEDVAEEIEDHEAHKPATPERRDPTVGWPLLVMSVATSLDALVVGFSLGLQNASIWSISILIGVVAAAMVLVGVRVGKRFGEKLGWWAEVAGAGLLMVLGVTFLL
jgi:putative Mn2+ efflux pump MntP